MSCDFVAVVLSDFTFTVYKVGSGELTQTSLSVPSSWSVAILESVDVRLTGLGLWPFCSLFGLTSYPQVTLMHLLNFTWTIHRFHCVK